MKLREQIQTANLFHIVINSGRVSEIDHNSGCFRLQTYEHHSTLIYQWIIKELQHISKGWNTQIEKIYIYTHT